MGFTSDPAQLALLRARTEDTLRLCERRYTPCYLGFLDEAEQQTVLPMLTHIAPLSWSLYGGHPEAERRMLGVFPDGTEPDEKEFPLTACAFRYRKDRRLTHRDFLGTLLSAGLRRDAIGDILCGDGLTVVFLRQEVCRFVCEQVDRVGGEGVTVEPDYTGDLPVAHTFENIRDTVAAPRLDAVVKALLRCSREQASELIVSGRIMLDHRPAESPSCRVTPPATVSAKGYGRFAVDQIGPETKKGRLQFFARKYC